MEKTIPWIGYDFYGNILSDIIERKNGLKVAKLKVADEGLEYVLNKNYPLIIVQDTVVAGSSSILPKNIAINDYPAISRHVIKTIKESSKNKNSSVVAIGIFDDGYNPIEDYIEAGANLVINLWTEYNYKTASDKIIELLLQHAA